MPYKVYKCGMREIAKLIFAGKQCPACKGPLTNRRWSLVGRRNHDVDYEDTATGGKLEATVGDHEYYAYAYHCKRCGKDVLLGDLQDRRTTTAGRWH